MNNSTYKPPFDPQELAERAVGCSRPKFLLLDAVLEDINKTLEDYIDEVVDEDSITAFAILSTIEKQDHPSNPSDVRVCSGLRGDVTLVKEHYYGPSYDDEFNKTVDALEHSFKQKHDFTPTQVIHLNKFVIQLLEITQSLILKKTLRSTLEDLKASVEPALTDKGLFVIAEYLKFHSLTASYYAIVNYIRTTAYHMYLVNQRLKEKNDDRK